MMMKRFLAGLLIFSLTAAVSPMARAQVAGSALSIKQWVRLSDGALRGTVVVPQQDGMLEAVAAVDVVIHHRDGDSFRVSTDSQGQFSVADVEPGVYALSVWQNRLLAACALQVIDGSHDPQGEYPDAAVVSIANVDRPTVKLAILRYLPAGVRTASTNLSGIDFTRLASSVRPNGNSLRIAQKEGGFSGQLFVAGADVAQLQGAAMANVFLLKDGEQVDRTVTDGAGQFRFEQVMPGVYSMLAIGPGGVGLIGFELTSAGAMRKTAATLGEGAEQLVSKLGEPAEQLAMQLAPVPEAIDTMDALMEEPVVEVVEMVDGVPLVMDEECFEEPVFDACCAPVCGGGSVGGGFAGGGGGGGGGGGFGGGGIGGLGALVGLGAVAAIASNDDNAVVIPRPASPAVPTP